ncbi:hypothetical protein ODR93_26230, partial [Escherichia coli]|nr:hypothetical protein [Escherichia coli]
MSVKITGLDKMQKQLKEVERATEALNGSYDVHFDANDPVSIENAIQEVKWFTEFGHLNRGDMLTSEQHRCHNEKKKFQRRV